MKCLIATSALVGFAFCAGSVGAAPIGNSSKSLTVEDLTTTVTTIECRRDDRGWHSMLGNRRITCRPAHPGGKAWGWRCEGKRCGWWHRGEKRWHD
jgi:hypothetical protein